MVKKIKIYLYKFVSLLNHMKSHPLWCIEWWVIQVGPWAVDRLLWRLGWLGELTGGHAIPGGTDGKMAGSPWKNHGTWGEIWWNPRKINRISWNWMKGHWFHPSFFGGITWNNGVTELFTCYSPLGWSSREKKRWENSLYDRGKITGKDRKRWETHWNFASLTFILTLWIRMI